MKLIAGVLGVGFDDLRQRELQRRNRRLALITGSAVVGMVVAIGLATTAIIARNEAEQQRARAETEAETARQTASFMIDLFDVSDPGEARGRTITAREILTRGAERIRTELSFQPHIQTSLMDTIGKVYTGLGLYSDASSLLLDAAELRRGLPELPALELARTVYNLANVLTEQAEYQRAAALYEEALTSLKDDGANERELRIDISAALAELYFRTGDYPRAEPVLRQVLDERLRLFGENDSRVAEAIEEIGLNQFDQGRLAEAESRLREALDLRWRVLGREPHPDIAENLNNLALVLMTGGDLEAAEVLYEQALAMNRRLHGDSHPAVALSLSNLAEIHRFQNELDLAASGYREALAMQRNLLGDRHPEVARVLNNLAFIYHDRGDLVQAIALSIDALSIQREALGDRHPNVAGSLAVLGRWRNETGEFTQARALLQEALTVQEAQLEAGHPDTAITRLDLAEALLSGDAEGEEALAQAMLSERDLIQALSADHWITALARQVHGAALLQLGRAGEAEPLLRESYERLSSDASAKATYVRKGLERLIEVNLYLDRPERVSALKQLRDMPAEPPPG